MVMHKLRRIAWTPRPPRGRRPLQTDSANPTASGKIRKRFLFFTLGNTGGFETGRIWPILPASAFWEVKAWS